MSILVTGATGNIGRQIVLQLRARGVAVRAMARRPESAGFPSDVEVVHGDLTLPDTLDRCLDGVDAVYLVWCAPAAAAPPAVERIVKRVPRVVFLSNMTVRDDLADQNFPVTTLHATVERLIAASQVQWTFLRPGVFATNALIWWAPQIRKGNVVRWPYPDAMASPIHERDIAAVAVRALCENGHAGAKYILTGPRPMTQSEQVHAIGDAIGRPVRFEEMPLEGAREELIPILSAPFADMLLSAWPTLVGKPALLTTTVADVTGSPARSFHDWAVDHAADFRE